MSAVVFLGPTLPVAEARQLVEARYLPPAAMGDVYDVVQRQRPDVVAIVDGYFDSVPAVWHKEILFALEQGARVVGAASMGALRAAELWPFGMEGSGWVFEAFRTGMLEDDDEVAVAHGDAASGYRSLSTAMVNIRVGLDRAARAGLIGTATRETLVELAKRRYYPERSWERLVADAADHGLPGDELAWLRDFVTTAAPDVKAEDAAGLLRALARAPVQGEAEAPDRGPAQGQEPAPPPHLSPSVAPTIFWDRLTRNERTVGPPALETRAEALRRFVKATDPRLPCLLRESLLAHLAEKECEFLGVELTQEQFDAAVRDFRLRRGLSTAESMQSWLERAGLTSDDFRALMEHEARVTVLLSVHRGDVDARLLDALALSGRLGDALARHRESHSGGIEPDQPSAAELEAFYRSRIRVFSGSLHGHARDLGFASASELIEEVRKVYGDGGGGGEQPCG